MEAGGTTTPRWKPLGRMERRLVGVLVEKAKTTPDQYPMTINGLITGSNQKSNRDPQMELEESDIIDALDRLKMVGAVIEVQGSGRVPKYRHLLYEWLGVNKVELAVMAELLLRGADGGRVARTGFANGADCRLECAARNIECTASETAGD